MLATSPLSPDHPALPLLGGWRLVRRLSRTRYFELFLAAPATCDPDWPADYVVKSARQEADAAPVAARLLQREVQVARSIAHPHLATILDEQTRHDPPFVVQPFYEGKPWELMMSCNEGRIASACWTGRQIAEALQALHQAGWVHGDVKPSNVIVSPVGHATLIDLGSARRLDRNGQVIPESLLELTAGYAAPEWFLDQPRVTPAADVYSLGVCLYETLTGERLFPYEEPRRLLEAHREELPPHLRHKNPQVPADTARLVHRMLAKDPTARPSIGAVIETLVRTEIAFFSQTADIPA